MMNGEIKTFLDDNVLEKHYYEFVQFFNDVLNTKVYETSNEKSDELNVIITIEPKYTRNSISVPCNWTKSKRAIVLAGILLFQLNDIQIISIDKFTTSFNHNNKLHHKKTDEMFGNSECIILPFMAKEQIHIIKNVRDAFGFNYNYNEFVDPYEVPNLYKKNIKEIEELSTEMYSHIEELEYLKECDWEEQELEQITKYKDDILHHSLQIEQMSIAIQNLIKQLHNNVKIVNHEARKY